MPVLRRNRNDCSGSFSSDRPAPDALGMSASLRSRPNLRTRSELTGVPQPDSCSAAKIYSLDYLVSECKYLLWNLETERLGGG